ncbi:MAG TPA: Fic family protein, partial [Candidatus Limnocylindrales bacterium]
MPRLVERVWRPSLDAYGPRSALTAFAYQAFVPDPIRDADIRLGCATVAEVEAAAVAVHELQSGPTFRGLEAVGRQLLRAEALASSRIEGLEISQRRIAKAIADGDERDETARSVIANIAAMQRAVEIAAEQRSLAVADILAIHDVLMTLPRERPFAGHLREVQNWLGTNTDSPRGAEFIPPPEEEVPGLMEDLVAFIGREEMSPVVQAALVHAQFETIHPFVDGNGRVGRALIHVVLRRGRVAGRIVPPVSVVLATNRQRYVEGLTAFRFGDVDGWIVFFARALADSAAASRRLGERLSGLEAKWLAAVRPRAGSAAEKLIAGLSGQPVLSVETARGVTGASFQATNQAIARLEAAGVLRPIRGDWRRNRLWESPDILSLLDEFEA